MTIILLSIDGLGLGSMNDTKHKGNTWNTIINNSRTTDFPVIKKIMTQAQQLELDYEGADSFLGHLTMSGVNVANIICEPLSVKKNKIIKLIKSLGYKVYEVMGMLIVKDKFVIYDNFENENGLAINIAATFDTFSFNKLLVVAQKIRKIIRNPRLIAFGASNISLANYLNHPLSSNGFFGLATAKSGVYNATFKVKHFGANVNFAKSVQQFAINNNYCVYLYGKFANIIAFNHLRLKRIATINPKQVFDELNNNLRPHTFHCINIQQTDLFGHAGDVKGYVKFLQSIDKYIAKLVGRDDVYMIFTSDHGNDPAIKDGKHTREYVPFWVNKPYLEITKLSEIATHIKNLIKMAS